MPDWRRMVSEHLAAADLNARDRDEVAAELASHLEEVYGERCAGGSPHAGALCAALAEVADWRTLARRIERAKREEGIINHRTKSIWIPGLSSFTVANLALALLPALSSESHTFWIRSGFGVPFPVAWLVAQPFFGAMGAYLSLRGGGERRARVVAGLFPSIVTLAVFSVVLASAVLLHALHVEGYELPSIFGIVAPYVAIWVGLPALALGLGVLPFLGGRKLPRASVMSRT